MCWATDCWLAFGFTEECIHLWNLAKCLDHGVTDDVSERNLATTTALQVVVDDGAIVDH